MTTEYIKMVLALPEEFFDGWEWQAGDRAILLDDHYKREVLVINTHSQIVSSRIAKLLFPGSLEGCKTEEHITRLRPIPNQEQLLKVCECDGDIYFESLTLSHFANWLQYKVAKRHDFCFKYKSAKEMMLLWVMEKKHNKEWNGVYWEKMK